MGLSPSIFFLPHKWREDEPDCMAPYKYDPQFGFAGNRKERVITATEEEMDSANIEDKARDFCVKYRIKFRGCLKEHNPFWYKCKGLENELNHCKLLEREHDMKEFEREKRLNARERRIREREGS